MDYDKSLKMCHDDFGNSIIPGLCGFIAIDNLSPAYDPEWQTNGKAERACNHLLTWAKMQGVKGLKGEVYQEKGRTPMLFLEIEANCDCKKNLLLYGHMDKQPHMLPWEDGIDPLVPTIKNGYLYGRGASDDGYATFTIVESIKIVQQTGGKHGKICITVEGGEESGSPDLVYYLNKLKDRIGTPDLMVCMDSGCINYDSLWLTTSLRGVIQVDLTVECLTESVHSGTGSGISPDSFTIMRILFDRLEDSKKHRVVDDFHVTIPDYRVEDAKKLADLQKNKTIDDVVKLSEGVKPLTDDLTEIILNNTWRPTLTVCGMTGFPQAEVAGNVLRNKTKCRFSMRLPPTLDANEAKKKIVKILTEDPPYNAKILVEPLEAGYGWAQKDLCKVLKESFSKSSIKLFGKDFYGQGEGGSIPFIYELGAMFPQCELLVTGVLGPKTNAHCPNECLNIDYTERMTVALAHAINDYCQ